MKFKSYCIVACISILISSLGFMGLAWALQPGELLIEYTTVSPSAIAFRSDILFEDEIHKIYCYFNQNPGRPANPYTDMISPDYKAAIIFPENRIQ
ncbi:MAG: hypothetical protein ACWA5R_11445 [bacterium]